MTDALVPSLDVAALEGLPLDEQIDAVGEAWRGWRRLEVTAIWTFGRALRLIKHPMPRGEFGAYIASIGMGRAWAYRLLVLFDFDGSGLQLPTAAIRGFIPDDIEERRRQAEDDAQGLHDRRVRDLADEAVDDYQPVGDPDLEAFADVAAGRFAAYIEWFNRERPS